MPSIATNYKDNVGNIIFDIVKIEIDLINKNSIKIKIRIIEKR